MSFQPGAIAGVYAPIPGAIIASLRYATTTTYVLGTSLAALDTTNLTLAFVVPSTGRATVILSAYHDVGITGTAGVVTFGLLNHTGGAQVGTSAQGFDCRVVNGNLFGTLTFVFSLSGLTALSTLQLDVAAGVTNAAGVTGGVIIGGGTGLIASGTGSPLEMIVLAA